MKKNRGKRKIGLCGFALSGIVAGFFVVAALPVVAAEEEEGEPAIHEKEGGEHDIHGEAGILPPQDEKRHGRFAEERERLLKMRQEDPEGFKAKIKERRAQLRGRLKHLKETDPAKYEEVMGRIRARRLEEFKRLRRENPEEFKRRVEERRQRFHERLEALRERDPQRYEKIVAHRKELYKLNELRKQSPERFREVLDQHPRLKERFEKIQKRYRAGGGASSFSSERRNPGYERKDFNYAPEGDSRKPNAGERRDASVDGRRHGEEMRNRPDAKRAPSVQPGHKAQAGRPR